MPTNRSNSRKRTAKPRKPKKPADSEQPCSVTAPSLPKVFIASSSAGKRLAEKLADALDNEEVRVAELRRWWKREAFPPGAVILDALRDQAEQIDFAVVLFTPDDEADITGSKAPRDNCVFELGLFMGALGLEPKRSLLLRDKTSQLLNDLGGLIYIDLPSVSSKLAEKESSKLAGKESSKLAEKESPKLPEKETPKSTKKEKEWFELPEKEWPRKQKLGFEKERDKFEEPFIKVAVEQIKSSVKDLGYCFNHAPRKEPRLIPKERLMDLEKRGQNLMDSDAVEVLINTMQPMELNHELAKNVCENMGADVTYTYFFQADPGSIKFFSSLAGALAAANLDPKESKEFLPGKKLNIAQWRGLMHVNQEDVQMVLETMRKQLRIYFLPRKPHLEFCVHNANHKDEAICYLRHTANSFVEWFKGESAKYVADELRTVRFADDSSDIVFQGTQGYELYGHANQRFLKELAKSTLSRFPKGDLRDIARKVCFGDSVSICL